MPFYHRLGEIPKKRHTVFKKASSELITEHLMGNLGFGGLQSLLYTLRPPTRVTAMDHVADLHWAAETSASPRLRHFRTHRLEPSQADFVRGRVPLLFNQDVAISIARPSERQSSFYRNGQGDEVVFVTAGQGVLETQFGEIKYRQGDYLVIPRGIIHRYRPDDVPHILFFVESRGYIRTPKRYRSAHGQLLEHSPFCERDIRAPERLVTHDEVGSFPILVKKKNAIYRVELDHHPFDTVGWDGFYFPWAFNIEDFEPITGRVHQPPPVHQTFEADGFVMCSFVPRLYDYHPDAIPAPYNHSNIGTDEVLYYCSDEFMSRKGIEKGSVTLHPDGLPHGPHPGTTEASIGQKETRELAVMIDTFTPLSVAHAATACEDESYWQSWVDS
jgi:homogentisate 1,2-dioxygenase